MSKEELPMHKDTYYFGYGIDIEKPDEMARQITKLKEENQELINQQKEFIKWLENKINDIDCEFAKKDTDEDIGYYLAVRSSAFAEILSKYKEIVGGNNDQ